MHIGCNVFELSHIYARLSEKYFNNEIFTICGNHGKLQLYMYAHHIKVLPYLQHGNAYIYSCVYSDMYAKVEPLRWPT